LATPRGLTATPLARAGRPCRCTTCFGLEFEEIAATIRRDPARCRRLAAKARECGVHAADRRGRSARPRRAESATSQSFPKSASEFVRTISVSQVARSDRGLRPSPSPPPDQRALINGIIAACQVETELLLQLDVTQGRVDVRCSHDQLALGGDQVGERPDTIIGVTRSGRSARLAHQSGGLGVPSSNLGAPTRNPPINQ
jgi:hypothetical protein